VPRAAHYHQTSRGRAALAARPGAAQSSDSSSLADLTFQKT
jgi:hypothetical protein